MPWFWIWTLLIIASLALGVFLLLHLWKKIRALAAELGRANEVLGELSNRTEELTEALEKLEEARQAATPEPLDPIGARQQMERVRKKRRRKRARRGRDHAATRRGWRALALDPRFDRWR